MFLKILKWLFLVSCIMFPLTTILHKFYICKLADNMKKSDFVAFLASILGLYILTGILLIFFISGIAGKFFMGLFSLSPFIIGKLATYKTEKLFTTVQISCIIISGIFVILYL